MNSFVLMMMITASSSSKQWKMETQEFSSHEACLAAKVWVDENWKKKQGETGVTFQYMETKCVKK